MIKNDFEWYISLFIFYIIFINYTIFWPSKDNCPNFYLLNIINYCNYYYLIFFKKKNGKKRSHENNFRRKAGIKHRRYFWVLLGSVLSRGTWKRRGQIPEEPSHLITRFTTHPPWSLEAGFFFFFFLNCFFTSGLCNN